MYRVKMFRGVPVICAALLAALHLVSATELDKKEPKDSLAPLESEPVEFSLTPFENEPECSSQGGLCVEQDLCPAGSLADKADESKYLCPTQKSRGAACCFGLPKKELPCSMRGGMCRERCGRALRADPLGICPDPTEQGGSEGSVCCPLLL